MSAIVFAFLYLRIQIDMNRLKQEQIESRTRDLVYSEIDNLSERLDDVEKQLNNCCSNRCPVTNQTSY